MLFGAQLGARSEENKVSKLIKPSGNIRDRKENAKKKKKDGFVDVITRGADVCEPSRPVFSSPGMEIQCGAYKVYKLFAELQDAAAAAQLWP